MKKIRVSPQVEATIMDKNGEVIMSFGIPFDQELATRKEKHSMTVLTTFGGAESYKKKYAFNIVSYKKANLDLVQAGVTFCIKAYTSDIVIREILDSKFNYVNTKNGDLKERITNTYDVKLVEIDLDILKKEYSFVQE